MPSTEITYLNTTYQQKELVKSLGARWDGGVKKWYVPAGIDIEPFKQWVIEDFHAPVLSTQTDPTKGIGLAELLFNVASAINSALPVPVWIKADIETAALNDSAVQKFIDGQAVKKVIVVPKKLVNVVI